MERVTNAGTLRCRHRLLFPANALKQRHVRPEETGHGVWSLYFGAVPLGRIDERTMEVHG